MTVRATKYGDGWYYIVDGKREGPFSTKDEALYEGEKYVINKQKEEAKAAKEEAKAAKEEAEQNEEEYEY